MTRRIPQKPPSLPRPHSDVLIKQLEALAEARLLLSSICGSEAVPTAKVTRVEAMVAGALQAKTPREADKLHSASAKFILIDTRDGEQLVERRSDSDYTAQPRCTREIYYSVAVKMAQAERSLGVHEIAALAATSLDDWPHVTKIRLLLRFWSSLTPSLIHRHQFRYSAADPHAMVERAVEQWVRIRSAKICGTTPSVAKRVPLF